VPTPNFDLYLVTDRLHTGGRDLLWVLEHALEGGVKAIQLREKDLSGKELFILAEKTRRLCQRYEAALLINDRLDVALAVDAAGVQLGKSSLPLPDARALLGSNRYIGASVHSLEEAQYAETEARILSYSARFTSHLPRRRMAHPKEFRPSRKLWKSPGSLFMLSAASSRITSLSCGAPA